MRLLNSINFPHLHNTKTWISLKRKKKKEEIPKRKTPFFSTLKNSLYQKRSIFLLHRQFKPKTFLVLWNNKHTKFNTVRRTVCRFSTPWNFSSISIDTEANGSTTLQIFIAAIWSAAWNVSTHHIVRQCCLILLSTFGIHTGCKQEGLYVSNPQVSGVTK